MGIEDNIRDVIRFHGKKFLPICIATFGVSGSRWSKQLAGGPDGTIIGINHLNLL